MKTSVHLSLPLLAVVSTVALVACGGGGGNPVVAPAPEPLTVAKASCATGNRPETGLQGQVDASLRANGFNGFNCNLDLVGSYKGDGAGVSFASFKDHAGRTCTYHSTTKGHPVGLQNPGVTVLDITDPATPIRTASLTSIAMLDPLESMRLNGQRQILVANNGYAGVGGPEVDVYDLSSDCRTPQLLASAPVGTGADGGVYTPNSPLSKGHEGAISPDGLTYYIGDFTNNVYRAIDITDPAKPKQIAVFDMKGLPGKAHGLSVSADGNRVYAAAFGLPTLEQVADPAAYPINGFVVLDTSEVQARKPNAAITLISTAFHKDGSASQHTLPMKVAGKSYLVQVDEGGSAGVLTDAGFKAACAAKLPPFPMARIYDIQDDSDPKLVSKLMLETHDPANCAKVAPDVVGLGLYAPAYGIRFYAYGSHFCSVDNRENATALACAYFNSGIRVFDIRDPAKPKELAYFNPASGPLLPGSMRAILQQWREGGPDLCGAQLHFDFDRKQLVSACMDNGVQVLQFAPNTWPFAQSVASALQQ